MWILILQRLYRTLIDSALREINQKYCTVHDWRIKYVLSLYGIYLLNKHFIIGEKGSFIVVLKKKSEWRNKDSIGLLTDFREPFYLISLKNNRFPLSNKPKTVRMKFQWRRPWFNVIITVNIRPHLIHTSTLLYLTWTILN